MYLVLVTMIVSDQSVTDFLISSPFLDTSMGEESIDAALLSHDASDETSRLNLVPSKTTTPFSVTELPTAVADSLNTAAKQLSHLYESVNSTTTTEHGEELSDENFDATEEENRSARGDDQLTNGLAEPYSAEPGGRARFFHLRRTADSFLSIVHLSQTNSSHHGQH